MKIFLGQQLNDIIVYRLSALKSEDLEKKKWIQTHRKLIEGPSHLGPERAGIAQRAGALGGELR